MTIAGTFQTGAVAGPEHGARVVLPGQSPEGEYILSVLLKRTYDIVPGAECVRAAADLPLHAGDVFRDHPMNSSLLNESDFIPFKPATDLVLNGHVYAPTGADVAWLDASLQVGERRKIVRVFGDREARWTGGRPVFTDPVPFTSMDVSYERAYGGIDVFSDVKVPYPYPRNPLGRGFVVRNIAKTVNGLALPNIEDPYAPLDPDTLCLEDYLQWESRPMPAGFGWLLKTWYPRALLAGVMPLDRPVEQELRKAYAELIPDKDQREAYVKNGFRDMDFAFFNGASPGLVLPFLSGGERIATTNLSPGGDLEFNLPAAMPGIGLDIGDGVQEPEVVLQTVMIRMDDAQVDLVWRGAVPYRGPDWFPEMRKMDVLVEG